MLSCLSLLTSMTSLPSVNRNKQEFVHLGAAVGIGFLLCHWSECFGVTSSGQFSLHKVLLIIFEVL